MGFIELELVPTFKGGDLLESCRVLWKHVRHKNIQKPIPIEICNISPHGSRAYGAHGGFQGLGKGSVLVVNVEVVFLKKVIRNKNIRPSILVYIADRDAQPKSNHGSIDACFFTYVGKLLPIVTEEFVSTHRVTYRSFILHLVEGANGLVGIVEQVDVQVSIFVVIKKHGMGRKTFIS